MKNTLSAKALEEITQSTVEALAEQGINLGETQINALTENMDGFLFETCNIMVTPKADPATSEPVK